MENDDSTDVSGLELIDFGHDDLCPCGSGETYKNCYLALAQQSPLAFHDLGIAINKHFDKRYCMHPDAGQDCKGEIIRAHSISRSSALQKVARDGFVYMFNPKFFEINKDTLPYKLKGIKQATTFTGFCSRHDTEFFRAIDTLDPSTPEHFMLMQYRAICRELFAMRNQVETEKTIYQISRGRSLLEHISLRWFASLHFARVRDAVMTLEEIKKQCDESLKAKNYDDFCFAIIYFEQTPTIAGSATYQPLFDFAGQQIPTSDLAYFLTCTLQPTSTGGLTVFAWHYIFDQQIRPFVQSLINLPKNRISDGLVNLVFSCFENQVASPDWWESLPAKHRTRLLNSLEKHALPHKNFPPNPSEASELFPQQERLVDWGFKRVIWL